MSEPIKITISFDEQNRAVLSRAVSDLNSLSSAVSRHSREATLGGRALRTLENDVNRTATAWRSNLHGAVDASTRQMAMFTGVVERLGRVGFYSMIGGATAAAFALKGIAKSFIDVNEQFAGFEITLRSSFGSSGIAAKLKREVAQLTTQSPIPFSDLADAVRSFSVLPYPRQQLAKQSLGNSFDDPQGFLRRSTRLVEQMLAFRPDKTEREAIFAIREALGGEFRSIIRRFDLPGSFISSVAGRSLKELKQDPGATFEALKKVFGGIITPGAIQQFTQQPRIFSQNLKEQLFTIPLLSLGDTGIYKRLVSKLDSVFRQVGNFMQEKAGDLFGPNMLDAFTAKISGSVQQAFDRIAKSGVNVIEILLEAVGAGKKQNPSARFGERAFIGVEKAVNAVATNLPVFIEGTVKFVRTLLPFIQKLAETLAYLSEKVLKQFVQHPLLTTVGVAAIPGLLQSLPYALGGVMKTLATNFSNSVITGAATAAARATQGISAEAMPIGATSASGFARHFPTAMNGLNLFRFGQFNPAALSAADTSLKDLRAAKAEADAVSKYLRMRGGGWSVTPEGIRNLSPHTLEKLNPNFVTRNPITGAVTTNAARFTSPTGAPLAAGSMAYATQNAGAVAMMTTSANTRAVTAAERALAAQAEVAANRAGIAGGLAAAASSALKFSAVLGAAVLAIKIFTDSLERYNEKRSILSKDRADSRAALADEITDFLGQNSTETFAASLRASAKQPGSSFSPVTLTNAFDVVPKGSWPDSASLASNRKKFFADASLDRGDRFFSWGASDAWYSQQQLLKIMSKQEYQNGDSFIQPFGQRDITINSLGQAQRLSERYMKELQGFKGILSADQTPFQSAINPNVRYDLKELDTIQQVAFKSHAETYVASLTDSLKRLGELITSRLSKKVLGDADGGVKAEFERDVIGVLSGKDIAEKYSAVFSDAYSKIAAVTDSTSLALKRDLDEQTLAIEKEFNPFTESMKLASQIRSNVTENKVAIEAFVKLADSAKEDPAFVKAASDRVTQLLNMARGIAAINPNEELSLPEGKMTAEAAVSFLQRQRRALNSGSLIQSSIDEEIRKEKAATQEQIEVGYLDMFTVISGAFTEALKTEDAATFSTKLMPLIKERIGQTVEPAMQGWADRAAKTLAASFPDESKFTSAGLLDKARLDAERSAYGVMNEGFQAETAGITGPLSHVNDAISMFFANWKARLDKQSAIVASKDLAARNLFNQQNVLGVDSVLGARQGAGFSLRSNRLRDSLGANFDSGSPAVGGFSLSAYAQRNVREVLSMDTEGAHNLRARLEATSKIAEVYAEFANSKLAQAEAFRGVDVNQFEKLTADAQSALDKVTELNKAIEEVRGNGAWKSFGEGFKGVTEMWRESASNFNDIGANLANSLRDNLSGAFDSFITGSENAGKAFQNFGYSILKTASQMLTNKLVETLLGNMFSSLGGAFGPVRTSGPFQNASPAITLATGGPITGGSGLRDDVPILGMGGEFVMNKNAVRKYGVGFMHALNSGSVPAMAGGGPIAMPNTRPSSWSNNASGGTGHVFNTTINYSGGSESSGSQKLDPEGITKAIRAAVVSEIATQQRQSGNLRR